MENQPLPEITKVTSPGDYSTLSLLLNYKCNFSCSYCYSAKGRSNQEISIPSVKSMLDYFIDCKRLEKRELTIFISGGGEPLLSWDTLKFTLEYADQLALEQGFKMKYLLMTNGSLLTDVMIECLEKHKVNVCVSFEILEEIQNLQRGQYQKVSANIARMIELGLVPSLSSVITAANVGLMEEMVETVIKQFPAIKYLNFDPAVDPGAFSSVEESDKFHDAFIDNFFSAQETCKSGNCRLKCTMGEKYGKLRERYCPGQLCMTPENTISICHCVSSPKEEAFERCNYGIVEPGKAPVFDMEKFTGLINTNVKSYPECENCFAKSYCGGGCLLYRTSYSPEMFESICHFTRRFVQRMLMNRMEAEYIEKFHRPDGTVPPERSINELTKLSILPNYTCNFSCSYCYSAAGRSKTVLDKEKARAVIDFFIDPARLTGRSLFMSVLGGGEPLLSWDVVKFVVSFARERAEKTGFTLGIGLTTNGSVISDEIIEFLKKQNVIVSISFEILEDVQNAQRQQYRQVCAVIDRLLANNVSVTIKSIITRLNVNRLEEMVSELICRFPGIKKLKLQPVEDNAIFRTAAELAEFYAAFTPNFFKANKLGEKHGMDVYCLAYKFANIIMEHYCGGELCLTPEGTISICHRVSSPQEEHYSAFTYGNVDGSKQITFDQSKFTRLITHDMHHLDRCNNCFAKYHCGGGCLAQAVTYDEEKLDVVCEWTREFLREILINRIESKMI